MTALSNILGVALAIKADIYECKKGETPIDDNLDKIGELFKNKSKTLIIIGKNLVFNGRDITASINSGLEAYKHKDFRNSGKLFADALLKATQTKSEENLFLY